MEQLRVMRALLPAVTAAQELRVVPPLAQVAPKRQWPQREVMQVRLAKTQVLAVLLETQRAPAEPAVLLDTQRAPAESAVLLDTQRAPAESAVLLDTQRAPAEPAVLRAQADRAAKAVW